MGKKPKVPPLDPFCMECGKLAVLVQSRELYPNRHDLWGKPMYRCECGAYVGCHPGTEVALGYPAGPKTRAARSRAHAAFDPLWKAKAQFVGQQKARSQGYAWMAGLLGIDPSDSHISHFDAATCDRLVEAIRQFHARRAA